MNIKSLITTFAIAASLTVASAKPVVEFNASASVSVGTPCHEPAPAPAPVVRDHRDRFDGNYTVGYWHARRPMPTPEPIVTNSKVLLKDGFALKTDYVGPMGSVDGRRGWGLVALTQPTRIEKSQTNREDFLVGGQLIHTIQLRGVTGSTMITRVSIEFMDEQNAQAYNPNVAIGANGTINIEIKNPQRRIKRIFVYGASSPNGTFQILAA